MNLGEILDKNIEEDIIKDLYLNNLYLSEKVPDTQEYKEITEKIKNIEKQLLNMDDRLIKQFKEYIEYISERDSIEMEFQFELGFKTAIKLIDILEKDMKIALANSKKGYLPPCDIWHLEDKVKDVLSIGNQTGEGWFLTAEMIEYIENGIPNIVCVQPFACLPNHVVGKGVIKTIREKYPDANISPVDYDPGASETNQANRIKLLMTVAKDNLKAKQARKKALENENKSENVTEEKTESFI